MPLPKYIKLVDVGPRDGLQNEKIQVPAEIKIKLINLLTKAGLPAIEAGSFVSPKWVPQMGNTKEVFQGIMQKAGVTYTALIPNQKGLNKAKESSCKDIAVFAAASESFSRANINCSITDSLARFRTLTKIALDAGMSVRAYISCALGCPYEGKVEPEVVSHIAHEFLQMGCYEISLGDTIGIGTAGDVQRMLSHVLLDIPPENVAVHFHDTYGQALTNIFVALQNGVSTIDASVAGLGGCPYAKGATGNVATEDVLYMLNGLGIRTDVKMSSLLEAGNYICQFLGRSSSSKTSSAYKLKDY